PGQARVRERRPDVSLAGRACGGRGAAGRSGAGTGAAHRPVGTCGKAREAVMFMATDTTAASTMAQAGTEQQRSYSPYRIFTSEEWAAFRADTPLTLTEDEVKRLRSLGDPVDLEEVRRIYLSLSRLLSAHVEASQLLFRQRQHFLNMNDTVKTPFIIGIAGPVAV